MGKQRERAQLRKQLEERREQLRKELRSNEDERAFLGGSRPAEMSEEAQEQAADHVLQTLGARHARELADTARALQKLDTDDYGICEQCGSEISPERLAALPAARYCLSCGEAAEDRH